MQSNFKKTTRVVNINSKQRQNMDELKIVQQLKRLIIFLPNTIMMQTKLSFKTVSSHYYNKVRGSVIPIREACLLQNYYFMG